MKHDAPSPRRSGGDPNRCWFRIGVWGSGRCEDLEGFIHCFNCPIYQSAGKELFSRVPSSEYASKAAEVLRERADSPSVAGSSHLIFLIGEQRFALSAASVRAVAPFSEIHTVPFRSNRVFLGLASLRGKLRLCYSLVEPLGLEDVQSSFRRMLLLGAPDASFVIPVSDVEGLTVLVDDKETETPLSEKGESGWITGSMLSGDDSILVLNENRVLDTFSSKQL